MIGSNKAEHDSQRLAVLTRIEAVGVTLNITKCEFNKISITFPGHKIDHDEIQADPENTQGIRDMRAPTTITELGRLLGIMSQLGKFILYLTKLIQPLRELLIKIADWVWSPDQREASTH